MRLTSKNGRSGFTLIEILVVIITLGVLAGLAAPVFAKVRMSAYKAEAITALSALRQSQIRYFVEYGIYADDYSKLDFDPNDYDWRHGDHSFDYLPLISLDGFTGTWIARASLKTAPQKQLQMNQTGRILYQGL